MTDAVSAVAAVALRAWRPPETDPYPFRRPPAEAVRLSRLARGEATPSGHPLDPAQRAEVEKLQASDRRVRADELAHQAAAGGAAGPASFRFTLGPDGNLYAIAGEVPIRLAAGRTPDETIALAEQARAAALASGDPSAQDLAVAAQAAALIAAAEAEKAGAVSTAARRTHRYVTAYERALAARLEGDRAGATDRGAATSA